MRSPALVIVLLVAFAPVGSEAAPTKVRTLKQVGRRATAWVRRTRAILGQTGVVATVEAQAGVGVSAIGDVGLRITPKDVEGHRKYGAFVSGEAHAFALGIRGTTSFDPALRGVERKYGPVGHGSPLYGDRISVALVPELLSVFAGRSGGLGLRLNLLPILSGPLAYLGRWGGTLYVTNPKLAPAAAWVLDKSDRVERKLDQLWERFDDHFALTRLDLNKP